MLYKVSFLIEKPEEESIEDFKEWVRCELLEESVPETNEMEFKVLSNNIIYHDNIQVVPA